MYIVPFWGVAIQSRKVTRVRENEVCVLALRDSIGWGLSFSVEVSQLKPSFLRVLGSNYLVEVSTLNHYGLVITGLGWRISKPNY